MLPATPVPAVTTVATPTVPVISMPTTITDVNTVPLSAVEISIINVSSTTEWHQKKGRGLPKTPRKGFVCAIAM